MPELRRGAHLKLLELLDDREHLLAHGLERRRHAEADVGEAHVAQALLAEGGAGAMPNKLVGENTAHVPQREGVVGVLEHAAVGRAQDVGEVLAPVGAHLRDVRVQARLPAAIAGAPAELDDQLARRSELAVGPPPGAAPATTRRRRRAGSRACRRRRSTGGRSGRRLGCRLVHRADDPTYRAGRPRREPAARGSSAIAARDCLAVTAHRATAAGAGQTIVEAHDLRRRYGEGEAAVDALAGVTRRLPRRSLRRDHGTVGLGQVDAHAHPRRPRPAHLGHGAASTASS